MLKKFSIIIAMMLFIFGFTNISFADTPNIYIGDVVKSENDDKVTMDLHMENVDSNISSLSLDIKYDESKLEYISSKSGKNLKATVQMSEYIEENKVSIGIMSLSGLKADGVYYQITFKVLNDKVDEIPVKLELKEATNSNGSNVKCNVSNGRVYTKQQTNNENAGSTIKPFDKTDVNSSDSLDDIVNSNTDSNISEKDDIKYEVENENIVQVTNNGTMIPNQNGTTQVKVKLNDEEIGSLGVEVENGEVKRVTSPGEPKKEEETTKQNNEFTTTEKVKKKSVTESGKKISPVVLILILIVIVIILIIVYKEKNKSKKAKKEKKDGKIS